MYTLIRRVPLSALLRVQAPAFVVSLLLAEVLYKFGSFALECVAFLCTWFVVDLLLSALRGGWRDRRGPAGAAES
jgi:hypothetical protein